MLDRKVKYLIKKSASKSSDLVLAKHAYIPELTVTLTKYYRNIVNMLNGIIKSYMCI